MRRLFSKSTTTLLSLGCCILVIHPVGAQTIVPGVRPASVTPTLDMELTAMPQFGHLQVGDRIFATERVENGFVARDIDSGEAVVVTDEALEQYEVTMPRTSSDLPVRISVRRQQLLGETNTLSVEAYEISDTTFTGSMAFGETSVPIAYHSIGRADEEESNADETEPRRLSDKIIIRIVVTAAVVGALGCAIAALATNCVEDCGEECRLCGGTTFSASEGLCGTCTCECSIEGLQPMIPNGEGCAVYH